jgi:putative transposase
MDWKTLLAYISGSVDEELLLRNEYLVAENEEHLFRRTGG